MGKLFKQLYIKLSNLIFLPPSDSGIMVMHSSLRLIDHVQTEMCHAGISAVKKALSYAMLHHVVQ